MSFQQSEYPSVLCIRRDVYHHLSLMLLTHLLKGSDVLTKTGRTSTGTQEHFWLDALPAATNNSCGYPWELNPGLLGTSPSLNQWATAASCIKYEIWDNKVDKLKTAKVVKVWSRLQQNIGRWVQVWHMNHWATAACNAAVWLTYMGWQ